MFAPRRCAMLVAVAAVLFGVPAWAASPSVFLTTSRGCLETGQSPTFQVGEVVQVVFRIGSSTQNTANARLFDILPDGRIGVFSFGSLQTNVVYSFNAKVAPPTGIEQLLLTAKTPDGMVGQRSCSFNVVANAPSPTRTATGGTPPNTPTVTPTPATSLTGSIRTNRGCLEDGDAATFAIGQPISVFFRVNSTMVTQAQVAVADILANGSTQVFNFGTLPTNTGFTFRGTVAPPTGDETLELRARQFGQATVNLDRCTFHVVSSLPPTATRTFFTRTRTPTRTPTRTRTSVPSSTPTPTPTATPTV